MKIGVTATRHGLTPAQLLRFDDLLRFAPEPVEEVHHGDCVGGDAQIAQGLYFWQLPVVVHPPEKDWLRAFATSYDNVVAVRDPKPYLVRNRDLVDDTDVLWAFPFEREEQVHSGTWATLRYARSIGRPVTVVYPDGSTEEIS